MRGRGGEGEADPLEIPSSPSPSRFDAPCYNGRCSSQVGRGSMQIIKKYANRKLYHTNRKQYITLDGIAELIQSGEPVQVVDNETGEDITATILSQVVLASRGREAPLPASLLTNIIQTGAGLSRSFWSMLSGESAIDGEIRRRVHRLKEEGTIDADEAARLQNLLAPAAPAEHQHAELPSVGDVARLTAQVDALTQAVEHLLAERQNASDRSP